MIDLDTLKKVISLSKDTEKIINSLQDLNIDLVESPLYYNFGMLFDTFIITHFTEEGSDLIFWWMFESVPKVIYDGETEVDVESIEDLWKYLELNNYIK